MVRLRMELKYRYVGQLEPVAGQKDCRHSGRMHQHDLPRGTHADRRAPSREKARTPGEMVYNCFIGFPRREADAYAVS